MGNHVCRQDLFHYQQPSIAVLVDTILHQVQSRNQRGATQNAPFVIVFTCPAYENLVPLVGGLCERQTLPDVVARSPPGATSAMRLCRLPVWRTTVFICMFHTLNLFTCTIALHWFSNAANLAYLHHPSQPTPLLLILCVTQILPGQRRLQLLSSHLESRHRVLHCHRCTPTPCL
jgi:hypothetical protein